MLPPIILLLFFLFPLSLNAEVNGKERVLSSGNMGPRALPIKEVGEIVIKPATTIGISSLSSFDFEKELSLSPQINIQIPWSSYCALFFKIEPFEYYATSEDLRRERKATNSKGLAKGDIYFGTNFHLFYNEKEEFHLHLNFLTKTTSGKKEEDARHTNSPAYQIDLSFFKKVNLFPSIILIPREISGYTGFLAWQTNKAEQNDAFAWGLKMSYVFEDTKLNFELGGYSGWQRNEDRPLAASTEVVRYLEHFDIFAKYQYGLRDMVTHNFSFGITYKYHRPDL